MKARTKSLLCTVMVIVVILGTLTFASAGTTGTFTNRQVNSSRYTDLTYSTKATTGAYGTAYISAVIGDSYATIRGGTSSASATAYGVSTGSTVSVYIPSAYRVKGDNITLYGQGLNYTYMLSGTWNAN